MLDESGEPLTDELRESHSALARLVAAIHREAPHVDASEIEQAILWLKAWKFEKAPIPQRKSFGPGSFWELVQDIRDSNEQVGFQVKALQCIRHSHAWTAVSGASLCAGIGSLLIPGVPLLVAFAAFPFAWWGYYKKSLPLTLQAALIWKDQEQRNLWSAVRSARTAYELNMAGLFARIPENELKAELYRLRDALYRNPNGWLDEYETIRDD